MDFDFGAGEVADTSEGFKAAPAARAADGVAGGGNVLQVLLNEKRNDNSAFDQLALKDVGDATIDDDAGVEDDQADRSLLGGETNVRNDQREIFLIAAHREDHADVTEAEKEAETNEPAGGICVGIN